MLITSPTLLIANLIALSSSMLLTPSSDQYSRGILSHNHKDNLPPGLKLQGGNFYDGCLFVDSLISYDYATINETTKQAVCNSIKNRYSYRLEGGGIVEKQNGACKFSKASPVSPDKLLCGQWSLDSIKVVKGKTCPEGTALMSAADAIPYPTQDKICAQLKTGESAKVGYHASITNKGEKNCFWEPWEDRELSKTVCVSPIFESMDGVSALTEHLCDDGQTLVTVEEVNANRMEYCKAIPIGGMVRIAGSGSLYGSDLDCIIKSRDTANLGSGLCANSNRIIKV